MSNDAHQVEIRIALVLYGGVSLAVYENGVARSFHDLVRRRGVFGPLLDLLDATAIVDVMSGASAGGINALMLAAALESGAEFSTTARLWRRLADIGVLLGDVGDAGGAESLLDGEYFQEQLIDAFRTLCAGGEAGACDFEIDVFVAGTDVDGHARRYLDGLGASITDKEHRITFHLQHRPGRKSLGVRQAKDDVRTGDQAEILGTLARITASFPVAFSPIRQDALPSGVEQALVDASHVELPAGQIARSFVDGGVLDNKPFGPALEAIFHRMPGGRRIDRRLFYVEPDPVPFLDQPRPRSSIGVGLASLTSIPSHEGIADDLEKLIAHNHRVDWLRRVRSRVEQALDAGTAPTVTETYVQTRVETLAQFLVLGDHGVPFADRYARDARRQALLDAVREILSGNEGGLEGLDAFDALFHLRRAFYLLYDFHNVLERERGNPTVQTAMVVVGRIIHTLRIILDTEPQRREELLGDLGSIEPATLGQRIVDTHRRFVGSGANHWQPLERELDAAVSAGRPTSPEDGFLASRTLSEVLERIRATRLGMLARAGSGPTVLDRLGEVLRSLTIRCDGTPRRFDRFRGIDTEIYPLEFSSGVYELDRIEFARISPADAQLGLSRGDPYGKVTGDELAHFAAFFSRDWRSNDILQGRFDGTCQIVRSLVTPEAIAGAVGRGFTFGNEALRQALPRSREAARLDLITAWNDLKQAWESLGPTGKRHRTLEFQEQLVRTGQLEAFDEDVETFFQDLRYQEIRYGRTVGPGGATSQTSDGLIEQEARRQARLDLEGMDAPGKLAAFEDQRVGSQAIVGAGGRVPASVVGEYTTLAYLKLWSMIRKALGARSGFLDRRRVRLFFRTPLLVIHQILSLARRERVTAALAMALIAGAFLGALILSALIDRWWLFGILLIALLAVAGVSAWLFEWQTKRRKTKRRTRESPGDRG